MVYLLSKQSRAEQPVPVPPWWEAAADSLIAMFPTLTLALLADDQRCETFRKSLENQIELLAQQFYADRLRRYEVVAYKDVHAVDMAFRGYVVTMGQDMLSRCELYAWEAERNRARWNQQSVTSGQRASEYRYNDLDGSQPDI